MPSTSYSVAQIAQMGRIGSLKSIRMLEKESGITKVIAALEAILCDLVLFFNVGKGMSPEQVKQTAELIWNEKRYLSIQDLQTCFQRAKAGNYGKLYDRLDGAIVFEFIEAYEKEKTEVAEHQSYTEHKSVLQKTDTEKKNGIHPDSQKVIDEIKSRLEKQLDEERQKKFERVKTNKVDYKNYSIDQKWIATFDKIYMKHGFTSGEQGTGIRLIKWYNRDVSMTDFLQSKERQYRCKKMIKQLKYDFIQTKR